MSISRRKYNITAKNIKIGEEFVVQSENELAEKINCNSSDINIRINEKSKRHTIKPIKGLLTVTKELINNK